MSHIVADTWIPTLLDLECNSRNCLGAIRCILLLCIFHVIRALLILPSIITKHIPEGHNHFKLHIPEYIKCFSDCIPKSQDNITSQETFSAVLKPSPLSYHTQSLGPSYKRLCCVVRAYQVQLYTAWCTAPRWVHSFYDKLVNQFIKMSQKLQVSAGHR